MKKGDKFIVLPNTDYVDEIGWIGQIISGPDEHGLYLGLVIDRNGNLCKFKYIATTIRKVTKLDKALK